MGTTREALEAALAAEPESVALHSAYADLLIEEGDPRGEYIRLELALEDSSQTTKEKEELKRRADELLTKYEWEWLGPLNQFMKLINPDDPTNDPITIQWKRGWLEVVLLSVMDLRTLDALRRCPVNKLIRSFQIVQSVIPCNDDSFRPIIQTMKSIPFHELILVGFESIGDRIPQILDRFLLDHRKLSLQLIGCCVTDDGAEYLAKSPHLKNYRSLNLDNNYLSPIGIAALAEVGFVIGEQRSNPG